jgi:hypothetical protein
MKMPFASTYSLGPTDNSGIMPDCGEIETPALRKYLSMRLFGCE